MSKYVLMHGTFVEVSDDELMHWKYIKREKVNGKWVYYYKDDLGRHKEYADRAYAESWRNAANVYNKKEAAKKAAENFEAVDKERRLAAINGDSDKLLDMESKLFKAEAAKFDASAELSKANRKHQESVIKANKAIQSYNSYKIKTFAARTISKGIVKVANLLSNLFSKKK